MKPSESFWFSLRCDGGGPGGGCTSDKSGEAALGIPLEVADVADKLSEMGASCAEPLARLLPWGDVGLGASTSEDRRLS